jgi:hypothetical protein
MALTFSTVAMFAVLFVAAEVVLSQLFKPTSSLKFASSEDYMRNFMKEQLLCRELQILAALLIGAGTGLLHCFWTGESPLALIAVLATLEVIWLGMTYVVRPQKEQRYYDMPNLMLACLAAICVGLFFCLSLGAAAGPLLAGGLLGALAWILLTPM